ncbi:MAG TPA: ABC transporter permease, partial [Blastocatellia bacterium]|nr:ABC transporter permease [Blastocatellia bacterium]
MTRLIELWRRFIFSLRRGRFDLELQQEIQFHLDLKATEHSAGEYSPDDPTSQAAREFGNSALIMERSRDVWSIGPIEHAIKDLRYAARILAKNPAFTLTAILILAVGIGASTAVFSAVDALLIRPLAVADQSRLVLVWKQDTLSSVPVQELSVPEFRDWQTQNRVFSSCAALPTTVYGYGYTVTGAAEPFQVESARVSADFFTVLGVRPELGRGFSDYEDLPEAPNVVVLSHSLWRTRFNSDPAMIGRQITMNGFGHTVIGIMPPDFDFPLGADVWTPLSTNPSWTTNRAAVFLQV